MAHTIEEIGKVLAAKSGNISATAKALRVTRQAIHLRVAGNDELKQIVADAREALVDVAECALLKQIKEGNTAAIIFTLKTQGKDRGYVERNEITGKNGEPLLAKGYITVAPDQWDKDSTDSNL